MMMAVIILLRLCEWFTCFYKSFWSGKNRQKLQHWIICLVSTLFKINEAADEWLIYRLIEKVLKFLT